MLRFLLVALVVSVLFVAMTSSVYADFNGMSIAAGASATLFGDAETEESLFGYLMPMLTAFFGVVCVLAILVTGFWKGRSWAKRV